MDEKRIVLIGGAPTVGKSYTARKIAGELKLPWISTDTIREQMREIVKKEDYPFLFLHNETSPQMAVEFLTGNSAKEIVSFVNNESRDVWRGVRALIETDYVWKSFIVEGVAIIPKLVSSIARKDKNIKVIFLIDEDINRVRKTIFTRGLWDSADKYPDSVKEKEVEWVFEYNNYIKKEAHNYGFPIVSIGDRKEYISKIKDLVKR